MEPAVSIPLIDLVRRMAARLALSVSSCDRLDVLGCTPFNVEVTRRLVSRGVSAGLVTREAKPAGALGIEVRSSPTADAVLITDPVTFYSEYRELGARRVVLAFRYENPAFRECVGRLRARVLVPVVGKRECPDPHAAFVRVLSRVAELASEGHHVVRVRVEDSSDYFYPGSDPGEVLRRGDAVEVRPVPPFEAREGRVWEAVVRAVDQVRFRSVSRCFQK
ncbi:MAG: hypothetical protein ABGY09_03185 [Euryarchaeota archaeon]